MFIVFRNFTLQLQESPGCPATPGPGESFARIIEFTFSLHPNRSLKQTGVQLSVERLWLIIPMPFFSDLLEGRDRLKKFCLLWNIQHSQSFLQKILLAACKKKKNITKHLFHKKTTRQQDILLIKLSICIFYSKWPTLVDLRKELIFMCDILYWIRVLIYRSSQELTFPFQCFLLSSAHCNQNVNNNS